MHTLYGCQHPNLEWARDLLLEKKPNITEQELETLRWDGLNGCYMVAWQGMWLGIETDGYIHS